MFKALKTSLIMVAVLAMAIPALAQGPINPTDFAYIFHLYYDHGSLAANRNAKSPFDLIGAPFVQSSVDQALAYRGVFIDPNGQNLSQFQFDPTDGSTTFTQGPVEVLAQYEPAAKEVDFYNPSNQKVLTIDMAAVNVCNNNGVCDVAYGETYQLCPNDCKSTPLPTTIVTPSPSASPVPSNGAGAALRIALYVLLILVGIGIIWFVIRRFRPPSAGMPPPNTESFTSGPTIVPPSPGPVSPPPPPQVGTPPSPHS